MHSTQAELNLRPDRRERRLTIERIGRILRRGPRHVLERAKDRARREWLRPWASVYPALLRESVFLRACGASDVDSLWASLSRQPFFMTPDQRPEWAAAFSHAYPDAVSEVLARAERVLAHEFDLLGSGRTCLGPELPWHDDFKTARRWPLTYSSDIEYNELDRPTDVKVPWELSRCQHFTVLGQAYWLSGDERFAREYVDEIRDWLGRNPYGYGVNWACAMDVALRAVSWIWGFFYLADSEACRDRGFRSQLLRALYLHGSFIASHLERGDVNGNHYLCDGVGMVFLGCLFNRTRSGRRWLAIGKEIVFDEIERQVSADGVDFECSTAYHRLVLEAFATSYLLLERHGETVPTPALERLRRMYDFVSAYTKPDGRAPLIGDADDGRIQVLGSQHVNDHRYLLSTGAAVFERSDLKAAASQFWDESFWLLGTAGLERFNALPAAQVEPASQAFPGGGFFILRNRHAHAVIDCGEVGMLGRGGHGHNDILSFELYLNGMNVITDCGAYLYTASREWRNRFRGTAFHNTVQIDDEEVNRFIAPESLWQLRYDAVPTDAAVQRSATADRFSGGHTGFERLPDPVKVSREIVVDNGSPRVLIHDELTGRGTHSLVWRFHLDPALTASIEDHDVRVCGGGREVWFLPGPATARMALSLEPGWVSPSYGVKTSNSVLVWRTHTAVPIASSWLIADRRIELQSRDRAIEMLRSSSH